MATAKTSLDSVIQRISEFCAEVESLLNEGRYSDAHEKMREAVQLKQALEEASAELERRLGNAG